MKKLFTYLLCGLCLTSPVLAQTTSPVVVQPPTGSDPGAPDPLRAQLDNLFANLDKSQVPSGRLDAYAAPLVPLAAFNGQLADSTRTTPAVFRALYATAYTASIYGSTNMPTLSGYNATVAAAERAAGPTAIPIMAQLVNYATVRPDAFSQNLLTLQNQQVYDVGGRSQSPYYKFFINI